MSDPASRMDGILDAQTQYEKAEEVLLSEEEAAEFMLGQLAEVRAQYDAIRLEKQARKDSVLTPELMAQLHDIDAEYADRESALKVTDVNLDAAIRSAVVSLGFTVDSEHLQAVYCNGRVSWDTRALDGYAKAHPELLPFRKESEPSVRIGKK